jgi:hypothetical protein
MRELRAPQIGKEKSDPHTVVDQRTPPTCNLKLIYHFGVCVTTTPPHIQAIFYLNSTLRDERKIARAIHFTMIIE